MSASRKLQDHGYQPQEQNWHEDTHNTGGCGGLNADISSRGTTTELLPRKTDTGVYVCWKWGEGVV